MGATHPPDLPPSRPETACVKLPGSPCHRSKKSLPPRWPSRCSPARTPRAVIGKLNAEMVKILRVPEAVERLAALGVEIVGNTPEEFARIIKADVVKWAQVVRASGAKAN